MLAPSEFGTIFPFFPLFLGKLWLYHLWRTSLCQATAVGSAFFDRRTSNLEFLTSIWLCSCLGVIYKDMSGSFKSMKILPKLGISVLLVRETQALSSENCTTSVRRDVTQTFSTRGRTSLKLCTDPQTARCSWCYPSLGGLYTIEIFLLNSFFVLSSTQAYSVSKGTSVENSLNSGMWNHFCSFDQARKLVVLIFLLCISISHLRKPVKQKRAISKPQR